MIQEETAEKEIESIITELRPIIRQMVLSAPTFGIVGVDMHFNSNVLKRIETTIKKSILMDN
jgi:hypothetical protein